VVSAGGSHHRDRRGHGAPRRLQRLAPALRGREHRGGFGRRTRRMRSISSRQTKRSSEPRRAWASPHAARRVLPGHRDLTAGPGGRGNRQKAPIQGSASLVGVVSFLVGKEQGDDHSGTQKRPQSLLRLRALARSGRFPAQSRTHIGTLLLVQGMSPRGHPALASRAPRGRGGVERAAPFGALPAARVRHVRRDVHAAPTRRPLLHASLHVPREALQASDRR
jgi:hypothetical protein